LIAKVIDQKIHIDILRQRLANHADAELSYHNLLMKVIETDKLIQNYNSKRHTFPLRRTSNVSINFPTRRNHYILKLSVQNSLYHIYINYFIGILETNNRKVDEDGAGEGLITVLNVTIISEAFPQ
jgi:hypothetical protein